MLDGLTELCAEVLRGRNGNHFAHTDLYAFPFIGFELDCGGLGLAETIVDFFVDDDDHLHSVLDLSVFAS